MHQCIPPTPKVPTWKYPLRLPCTIWTSNLHVYTAYLAYDIPFLYMVTNPVFSYVTTMWCTPLESSSPAAPLFIGFLALPSLPTDHIYFASMVLPAWQRQGFHASQQLMGWLLIITIIRVGGYSCRSCYTLRDRPLQIIVHGENDAIGMQCNALICGSDRTYIHARTHTHR